MVMDSEEASKCAYIVRSFVAFVTGLNLIGKRARPGTVPGVPLKRLTEIERCEK
jgi:hypothetical protein